MRTTNKITFIDSDNMCCEKKNITIRVSGTDQNGTDATSDATSDAIEFCSNSYWSFNAWVDSLTGSAPTVTLEVSNDSDVDSFVELDGAVDLTLPCYVESEFSKFKYMRVVYTSGGATGGTKEFRLLINQ